MSGLVLTAAVVAQIALACPAQGVSPERVSSTAHVESGYAVYAINDNLRPRARSYTFDTKADATEAAQRLLRAGHNIDAGVMQINASNWQALGLDAESVFDPRANICAAKVFLARLYDIERQGIERRVSCRYNTGRGDCSNGYPEKIAAAAGVVRVASDPQPAANPVPDAAHSWDVWGHDEKQQEREVTPPSAQEKAPATAPAADPAGIHPVTLQAVEIK